MQHSTDIAYQAVPLTELIKKSKPDKVVWTPEADLGFNTLKKALVSATFMKNPDPAQTFVLQTDASNVGVGAVQSQDDDDRPNCLLQPEASGQGEKLLC